jgi:hypothetical protein
MLPGGNSEEPSQPRVPQADHWETLLEQMAEDVHRIRGVVVLGWYVAWFFFAVATVVLFGALALDR